MASGKIGPEGRANIKAGAIKALQDRVCQKCGKQMRSNKGAFNTHVKSCGREAENFWAKADKGTGCWIFNGCRDKWGYAQHGTNGRRVQAHRHAYELTHGAIPDDMMVLHSCDNPPCVNPAHLGLGTNQDNMNDKKNRGRSTRGEAVHTSKLTAADVLAIRSLKGKVLQKEIARQYGLSLSYVCSLWARRTWKHLP